MFAKCRIFKCQMSFFQTLYDSHVSARLLRCVWSQGLGQVRLQHQGHHQQQRQQQLGWKQQQLWELQDSQILLQVSNGEIFCLNKMQCFI